MIGDNFQLHSLNFSHPLPRLKILVPLLPYFLNSHLPNNIRVRYVTGNFLILNCFVSTETIFFKYSIRHSILLIQKPRKIPSIFFHSPFVISFLYVCQIFTAMHLLQMLLLFYSIKYVLFNYMLFMIVYILSRNFLFLYFPGD